MKGNVAELHAGRAYAKRSVRIWQPSQTFGRLAEFHSAIRQVADLRYESQLDSRPDSGLPNQNTSRLQPSALLRRERDRFLNPATQEWGEGIVLKGPHVQSKRIARRLRASSALAIVKAAPLSFSLPA